ncbi:hypothetical protein HN51_005009 [Arachis hypogaea]
MGGDHCDEKRMTQTTVSACACSRYCHDCLRPPASLPRPPVPVRVVAACVFFRPRRYCLRVCPPTSLSDASLLVQMAIASVYFRQRRCRLHLCSSMLLPPASLSLFSPFVAVNGEDEGLR